MIRLCTVKSSKKTTVKIYRNYRNVNGSGKNLNLDLKGGRERHELYVREIFSLVEGWAPLVFELRMLSVKSLAVSHGGTVSFL